MASSSDYYYTLASSYDYDSVVRAVLRAGASQWNLIGKELGMLKGEMDSETHHIPSYAGKLEALITVKTNALGKDEVKWMLIKACDKIPERILGVVKKLLEDVWTMSKSYSYDSVVSAVLKVGSHNWNLLGDKLGLTEGEMSSATSNKPTDPGKLQAIINMKRDELGDRELVRQLLDACEKIPQPILGQVLQRLDPLYNPEASVLNIGGRIVSPNQPVHVPVPSPAPAPAPAPEADEVVTPTEIGKLAKELGGNWDDFALDLDPDMFQICGNISAIRADPNYRNPRLEATAMLETWRNGRGNKATCGVLIKALCSSGRRMQANKVFGDKVTDSVVPQ